MNGNLPQVAELADHVLELSAARTPTEVFRVLLDSALMAAPRAALFLVRRHRLTGWDSRGYTAEVAARLRTFDLAPEECWLARVVAPDGPPAFERQPDAPMPDFGAPPSAEAFAFPVRVAGRVGAVLVVERGPSDPACQTAASSVLASVAGLRLESDLAWRKLQTGSAAERKQAAATSIGPEAKPDEPPRGPDPSRSEAQVEPEARVAMVELETADVPDAASEQRTRRISAARSFARLVATDIRLYNEEAVMLGRRNRDLAARLGDQLARGRETFGRRFGDMGADGLALLHDAYVQVLAAGDATLLPHPAEG